MKYENFEQVRNIVEKIKKLEKKLNIINSDPDITIKHPALWSLIEIPTDNKAVDFYQYAKDFLSALKKDLERRIENQKSILDKL